MGQKLGLYYPLFEVVAEGYVDWLEPDVVGPWVEVSRSGEYQKDKIEFIVDSYEPYDPPLVPSVGGLPVRLSEGKLIAKVGNFDGEKFGISVAGLPPGLMTVTNHVVRIDRIQPDANTDLSVGQGLLSTGKHTITIEAYGDVGVFNFDIPAEVVAPVEIETPAGKNLMDFDSRAVFQIRLRNNTGLVQMAKVSAVSTSRGWRVDAPINDIAIEPYETTDVPIHVYAHPPNDSSMSTDIRLAAVPDQGTPRAPSR